MKILEKNSLMLVMEFSDDEIKLLDRVVEVPLSAFGLNELLEKTKFSLDEIKLIKEKIESCLESKTNILKIEPSQFFKLKTIFKVASEIVDPNEMHAITGYAWDDALKLQSDLDQAI